MGWRTVVVNKHSKLSYKNNHLVFKAIDHQELIHLSEIDVLLLETTDISLTTMLLKRLIDEKILVLFCDDKRLPIGKILPFYGRHDSSLQLTRQLAWTEERKGQVWTAIIAQKITNQSLHLAQRDYGQKAAALLAMRAELRLFDPANREGHAARSYFNTLFGNDFTREQENDINAGLNLMEPFRPLVDQIIYENRKEAFPIMKRKLFALFMNTYMYKKKQMFLTNIATDYTKHVVKVLNQEEEGVPEFGI